MNRAYPNIENCSPEELERYIRLAKNVSEKNRLLGIQMLWNDIDVLTVSKILCVSDVAVYNWIHRFNSKGLDGLLTRARGGRPRRVSKEQVSKYLNVFEQPQEAGEAHWTAKKFHGHLQGELKVEISYQRVLDYLHEHDYKLKYGRTWPREPEGNEERREEFQSRITELRSDPDVKIWYMDEAGFDGDPRPRRGWYKKGKRKKIYRTQKHIRMNVAGMCCPDTGEFFALEFPYSNKETFQCFLNSANQEINHSSNLKEFIILDNASWHRAKNIDWGRFIPLFLPPYSPDMNPIERIWAYLKQTYFSDYCALELDQLIKQLDIALCHVWENPDITQSIIKNEEKLT